MFKTILGTSALVSVHSFLVPDPTTSGSSALDAGPFLNETWFSGLIQLEHDDDIFYWWFESRNQNQDAPVVLWLTGGPGCASEIALFYENGPY